MSAEDLRPIRVAYLDPPYPGSAHYYSVPGTPEFHPEAMKWDDPAEHLALMQRAEEEFPDGWALSTDVTSLRALLTGAPARVLPAAWCRGGRRVARLVQVIRAWEPVLYSVPVTPRAKHGAGLDWTVAVSNGHTRDGKFQGAKPRKFSFWLFRLLGLGMHPGDELVDMFPGSGAVTRAWDEYRALAVTRRGVTQGSLFSDPPPTKRAARAARLAAAKQESPL